MARKRVAKRQSDQQPEVSIDKSFSGEIGPLIVANLFGAGEIPISTGYMSYAKDYQELAWVYAAAFAIATGSAIVPWNIWKGKPGESDKLEYESEQVQLFEHPNPDMTWFDLLEATMTFLELQGDEYWEVGRNKIGTSKPKAIYPLRPNRITIIPTRDGREVDIYRFKMSPYAKDKVDFKAKDVIHYLYFNPLDDWYGQFTLSAAAQACRSERYTVSYNQGFFKRDATPAGYLRTDLPMKREQAEEIAKKWTRNLAGVEQSHKTVVLPSGLEYRSIGITPQDMQFLKQRQYNREEILSVFGVPPVKVGLLEHAKYDNYQLQEAAFYRDTIQPKLIKVAGKLTAFLRREWGGTFTFEFDLSQFLVADKDAEINRMYKEFSMGSLTPNQVIAETKRGEAYGEEGDQHYIHSAFVQVGAESVTSGERQATAVAEETKQEMEKVRTEIKALMDSGNKVVEDE